MNHDRLFFSVYEIQRIYGRHIFGRRLVRRYGNNIATDEVYNVAVLRDTWNGRPLTHINDEMSQMWRDVLQHVQREGVVPSDLIRIHISHQDLKNGDIKVPLQRISQITPDAIMERISTVMQSYHNLMMDDVIEISVGMIRLPRGRARHNLLSVTNNSLKHKKSIVVIDNTDSLCLPRSLVVCEGWKLHQEKNISRSRWRNLCETGDQTVLAEKLMNDAGLNPQDCSDLSNISKYESHMNANIVVVGASQQNSVIYPQHINTDYADTYYIYYVDSLDNRPGHFHAIKSMTGLLNVGYFCTRCLNGYHHKGEHHCQGTCEKCKFTACVMEATDIKQMCDECGVEFRSRACYDRHKIHTKYGGGRQANSVCQSFWQCKKCRQYFEARSRTRSDHQCGEFYCKNCKIWAHVTDHQCYIRRPQDKKPRQSLIVFDFECNQESGIHIPNLVVARRYDLKTGSHVQVHFRGDNVSGEFGMWLFQAENKNSVVMAHNMKGYDGYFLLDYLVKNGIKHNVIYAGSKIMCIKVEHRLNMDIIDSLNFFPMSLSKLPKTFGLDGAKKGDFPHTFNTSANYGFVGGYPTLEHYGIDMKKREEREEFIKWYDSVKHQKFDFERELLEYCVNDVDILAKAVLEFRKHLLETTKVDPLNYVTIASTTMGVYKHNFLEEDLVDGKFSKSKLALVPSTGEFICSII